jgi:recombinational DNA repair ATPase RecF
MPDDPKQVVLARLRELREALRQQPISDRVTNARHQCDRLEHGLSLAHPEGIRFSAHTLLKLLDSTLAPSGSALAQHREQLLAALEGGGFPH